MPNDLTRFLDVCKSHIIGFSEFKPKWYRFKTNAPYLMAAMMVKSEYWDEYLDRAIVIAENCTDLSDLLNKIEKLNKEIASEWYDRDIIL